jgi:hypothetical protein
MTRDLGTATFDSIAVLAAALPSDIKVFSLSAQAVVTVDIDVNDMAIPYTIAIERQVLIKSVVNRRAVLPPMSPGTYRLSWSFAHVVKEWMHKVSVTVEGNTTILEECSEQNRDSDHSIGVAFLVVG